AALIAGVPKRVVDTYAMLARVARAMSTIEAETNEDEHADGISPHIQYYVSEARQLVISVLWHPMGAKPIAHFQSLFLRRKVDRDDYASSGWWPLYRGWDGRGR